MKSINEFESELLANIEDQYDEHDINKDEFNKFTNFVYYVVMPTIKKHFVIEENGLGDEDLRDDRGNNNEI